MPLFIAAGISAAASIGSALIGSSATSSAAGATAAGAQQATQEQAREFNQTQTNLAPWLDVGTGALGQLATLYGITPTSPSAYTSANVAGGGGTSSMSPGMQAAYSVLQSGATNFPKAGGIMGGRQNATAIMDIAGAIGAGKTITDAQWAQAGYGPGGSAPGSNTAAPSASGSPTLAQANPQAGTGINAPGGTQAPTSGPVASVQANSSPNLNTFWQSPDYQFRFQQGIAGTDAGAAARGALDSGATRKAEINYAGNLAAGDYNNYANRLAALAGVGQTTASNLGQLGAQYASNIGNIAINQGNNLASSYLAQGQNYGNAIGSLAGIGSGLIQNSNNYSNANGGFYNGSYLAPFNSSAAAQGF